MRNLLLILVIALVAIVLGMMLFSEKEEVINGFTIDDALNVGSDWMENHSPTYTHDGSGLEVVGRRQIDDVTYEFTFEFLSSTAGYGDRTDEMVAQVITPHTTVMVVKEDKVESAITDGLYSEIDEEMLVDDSVVEEMISFYFVVVEDDAESVVGVERSYVIGEVNEKTALEILLKGPTTEEEAMGYSTAINEGVEIIDFSIEDGVAMVDFSLELGEGVAGSAMVMAIREQIEKTLKQFDSVSEVTISIEGETEEILQP